VSRRAIIALIVAAVGLIVIGVAVATSQNAVDYIKKHYKRDGTDRGAPVYISPYTATQTAQQISDADGPGDRRTTESGVFLRYPREMIAVLAAGRGSHILVANQRTGYGLFYGYVGGFWGTYSGRAGAFRGGGPGAGK
jgi:Domain of unknown function (DUF4247)